MPIHADHDPSRPRSLVHVEDVQQDPTLRDPDRLELSHLMARQSCEQTEGHKAAMLVIQNQEKNFLPYPTDAIYACYRKLQLLRRQHRLCEHGRLRAAGRQPLPLSHRRRHWRVDFLGLGRDLTAAVAEFVVEQFTDGRGEDARTLAMILKVTGSDCGRRNRAGMLRKSRASLPQY